jgi:hypothetical protein
MTNVAIEAIRWATHSPYHIPDPVHLGPSIHLSVIFPLLLTPLVTTTLAPKPRVRVTPSPSLIVVTPKSLPTILRSTLLIAMFTLSSTFIVGFDHTPSNTSSAIPLLVISESILLFDSPPFGDLCPGQP